MALWSAGAPVELPIPCMSCRAACGLMELAIVTSSIWLMLKPTRCAYTVTLSVWPASNNPWMTLICAWPFTYTAVASCGLCDLIMSPSSSEHSTLSSLIHFSSSSTLLYCTRRCPSSTASTLLSLPFSSRVWKYTSKGAGLPSSAGRLLNLSIVSEVLKKPAGDSLATKAASLNCLDWNNELNRSKKNFSAPGRPFLAAMRIARSGLPRVFCTYGTTACSFRLTLRT
mmetsp:Transcript_5944/g.17898  ORF Transcript_5944/g.17898 Transcript_5944/m.17898 type:complete len:227 (-) Transcript_5944:1021-1701(-)